MLKSVILTTLSLLASPAFKRPISWLTVCCPDGRLTVPEFARYFGPLTRQLYVPEGRPVVTVKKPKASVLSTGKSDSLPFSFIVRVIGSICLLFGWPGGPCQLT